MAGYNFMNELNNVVRMDEPITRGPMPRWQKKCVDSSNSRFVSLYCCVLVALLLVLNHFCLHFQRQHKF